VEEPFSFSKRPVERKLIFFSNVVGDATLIFSAQSKSMKLFIALSSTADEEVNKGFGSSIF
jgi:hypothetical protein